MKLFSHHLIGILLKDGVNDQVISQQFNGTGVNLGSLLLVPSGVQKLQLEKDLQEQGWTIATLHPTFSSEELMYLRNITFSKVKKRAESIHGKLDGRTSLQASESEKLLKEARWMKDILSSYWYDDVDDEVKRIVDLTDVLISRLIELSKPHVLEVVKIEN